MTTACLYSSHKPDWELTNAVEGQIGVKCFIAIRHFYSETKLTDCKHELDCIRLKVIKFIVERNIVSVVM